MTTRTAADPLPIGNAARVHIRWMIRHDLPSVLAISAASPDPWGEERFLTELRQRNQIGMIAEADGVIVGYMIYALDKYRLDLLTLAVAPAYRRRGVGRQLIAKLAGKLSYRRTELRADVRESRMDALRFCTAVGLRAVGVLREHYGDTGEDAYAMRLEHDGRAA